MFVYKVRKLDNLGKAICTTNIFTRRFDPASIDLKVHNNIII